MQKKWFSLMLAVPLLAMATPAFAQSLPTSPAGPVAPVTTPAGPPASSPVPTTMPAGDVNASGAFTQALSLSQQLTPYLSVNAAGMVVLSPLAVSALPASQLATVQSGIIQLNGLIAQGAYTVIGAQGSLQIQEGPDFSTVITKASSTTGLLNPQDIIKVGNQYWISLTQSSTQTLITVIKYSGPVVAVIVDLLGLGILGVGAAAVAGFLMSLGADKLEEIDRNNGNNGLVLIYTPPLSVQIL